MSDPGDAILAEWAKAKESLIDDAWSYAARIAISEARIGEVALALAKGAFVDWVREVLDDE